MMVTSHNEMFPNLGHLGSGDYELKINDDANLEYILSLVKQAIIEV